MHQSVPLVCKRFQNFLKDKALAKAQTGMILQFRHARSKNDQNDHQATGSVPLGAPDLGHTLDRRVGALNKAALARHHSVGLPEVSPTGSDCKIITGHVASISRGRDSDAGDHRGVGHLR